MAPLAGLFREKGWRVTGSDAGVYPPMSEMLKDMGIEVREGYSAGNLRDSPDLVVVGNAVSRDNPEVVGLMKSGLPYMSMPQALWEHFLRDRERIVVAGTHGKTTTSSLLAWVLSSAGLDPSFLIGGIPRNFSRGFGLGKGRYFIVEGDEYDTAFFDKGPKFLHYKPSMALLTAVEFDHADIYKDLEQVKGAFRRFVSLIPGDGYLAVSADYSQAHEVSRGAGCRVETYGINPDAAWRMGNGTVTHDGKALGTMILPPSLSGRHNVMNALGVTALCSRLGLGFMDIARGLESFEGVKRRLELIGEAGGVVIIDDFAHHPTAIRETISAVRGRYPGRRLWAVFEPRSNTSRRNVFQKETALSLSGADAVVVAGVFHPQKIASEQRFSPEEAVGDILALGKKAEYIETVEAILEYLIAHTEKGDVVVCMSNGPFGGLPSRLLRELSGQ